MSDVGWTAVALSRDLEPGAVTGVIVDGREWALWRSETGRAHIWEDRCPHRGMRMSFGFVRGERLACLYHGWEFGAEGRCLRIPAHPRIEVPPTITVWRHGCREAMGMIFARLRETTGEPALRPQSPGLRWAATSIHSWRAGGPSIPASASAGPSRSCMKRSWSACEAQTSKTTQPPSLAPTC